LEFKDVLKKGLDNSVIDFNDLKECDFTTDKDAFDFWEAMEILHDRGIKINY